MTRSTNGVSGKPPPPSVGPAGAPLRVFVFLCSFARPGDALGGMLVALAAASAPSPLPWWRFALALGTY
jgi:hypothetical protein